MRNEVSVSGNFLREDSRLMFFGVELK